MHTAGSHHRPWKQNNLLFFFFFFFGCPAQLACPVMETTPPALEVVLTTRLPGKTQNKLKDVQTTQLNPVKNSLMHKVLDSNMFKTFKGKLKNEVRTPTT